MKLKDGFMLRELAGSYVVVPTGSATVDFNGMITLNETGAFLFGLLLEAEQTEETLAQALLAEYDVDAQVAAADIRRFVEKVKKAGLLD